MCLIKRHKGKFNFSNKTIDKSIPATRCCWYPFSRIECCKWFKDKSVTRYNIMVFTIFFIRHIFFLSTVIPKTWSSSPYNTIQYNTICKYFQKVQNISSFSLVSCNTCSLCIGKGSWIWVVCVRRRIRLLIANHSVGKKKFLSKCYSITLQRQKTGWHRQK